MSTDLEEAPRGGARTINGRHYARARYGQGRQIEKVVPWAKTKDQARAVGAVMAELLEVLASAGRIDMVDGTAKRLALATTPKEVAKIRGAVSAIVKGAMKAGDARFITFEQFALKWTSGELARLHPDHVAKKDASDDVSRLRKYINPQIRNVPIHAVTVAHGDLVMAKLPLEKIASRRHIAQILHRVMELAVYPGKLITSNPFPRTWMPRLSTKKRKRFFCLWPREELQLLQCEKVPFIFRLFCGVLAREGMREAELLASEWDQWNLEEGTFTTRRTKTDDPRMWVVSPDVARAMRAWRKVNPKLARPFSGVLAGPGQGNARYRKARGLMSLQRNASQLASVFRDALGIAGVERAELFVATEFSGRIRIHDLRATFVTISLANGKADTWIRDRTGHKTVAMIDRYRRESRQFAELKLGALTPLDKALRPRAPTRATQLGLPSVPERVGKGEGTKVTSRKPGRNQ